MPLPPATSYGRVNGTDGLPQSGMTVEARMGGVLCGTGETLVVQGEIYYMVQVASGCGDEGQPITVTVEERSVAATLIWDNRQIQRQDLSLGQIPRLFLPNLLR